MEPIKRPHFRRQVPIQTRHSYSSISQPSDHENSSLIDNRRYTSSKSSSSGSSSTRRTDPTLALQNSILISSPKDLHSILTHNPNITPSQKTRSLHQAIANGSKECIRMLLDHGVDINGLNSQGISPLQAAIREKCSSESIAKMLISRGADLSVGEPLHWAARRDWPSVVDMLCIWGVEVDRISRSRGGAGTASSGIRNRKHRNGRGSANREGEGEGVTALHIASYYDSLASAKILIAHGAAVELHTSSGEMALAEAISNRSVAMVDLLLGSGISIHAAVDGSGGTPLMAACCLDDVGLVRCLMGHGAARTVECRDREGETAVSVAAAWAGREVMECLVDADADLNVRNEKGETPLEIAIRKGRPVEVVEVLLRAGARRDEGVEDALEGAVRDGGGRFDFEVVGLLNKYGRPAGRRHSRKALMSDWVSNDFSERSDETVRGGADHYGRVTRYATKRIPDFTRSSSRGTSPASSVSFDDGMSTEFESSVWSGSKWDPSELNRDRRIMKWSADQYISPLVGMKAGSLFSKNWGDGYDSDFDEDFGSVSSEYGFGRRSGRSRGRGRGTGRGRFANVVSVTVYA